MWACLLHPRGIPHPIRKPTFSAGWSGLDCESQLAFLALFGELLSAFFGMDENIVRVAQFFVPSVSDSAEAVTIIGFDAGNGIQGFVVDLSLQPLRVGLIQTVEFAPEHAGIQGSS